MIIYKATNKTNGKHYIGSTSQKFEIRKYQHCWEAIKGNSQKVFHRALRKYGVDNFDWEVLKEVSSKEEMLKVESDHIKIFDSFKNGYNSTEGNDNTTLGYKFTDKQIAYLKKSRNSKPNPNQGNHWTEEQKQLASNRQKENHQHLTGENNPSRRPEVRQKLSEGKLGKNNPMAKNWSITYPDGKRITLQGGIKRFLKDNGLTYMMITPMLKGQVKEYKGWKIKQKD